MIRRLVSVVTVSLVLLTLSDRAGAEDKRDLVVMTRNMDAGTDFEWFFVFSDVMTATAVTFAEVQSSNPAGRAELIAGEIAAQQPDLIALQEVSLWQAGPPAGPPDLVLDQLQLLLAALQRRGLQYAPVTVNILTSIAAPASPTQFVSFLDRDVILARTDLKNSDMRLSNAQTHIYQAEFGFPVAGRVVPVLRGWSSVDVKARGKVMHFVNTHLESPIDGIPQTVAIQTAQADELLQSVTSAGIPAVIAGDFNANAEQGPGHTPATDQVLAAGFTDAWRVFNSPGTGFTWPLFFEDFLSSRPVQPFERIDLIFERYLNVLAVGQTGLSSPWPSDHVGVVATVQLEP
jgi:endonuclease/exonuclease/phosphatase family metal-dependent hydrolase